jgi:hypothetical protein
MSLLFARVGHAFPPVDLLRTDYVQGEVPVASKLQGVLDFVALAAASPYGQRVGPAPVVRKVNVEKVARRKVERVIAKMEAASQGKLASLLGGPKKLKRKLEKLSAGGAGGAGGGGGGSRSGMTVAAFTASVSEQWGEEAAAARKGDIGLGPARRHRHPRSTPTCPEPGSLFDLRHASEFMPAPQQGWEQSELGVVTRRSKSSSSRAGGEAAVAAPQQPPRRSLGGCRGLPTNKPTLPPSLGTIGGGSSNQNSSSKPKPPPAALRARPVPPERGGYVEPACYAVTRAPNPGRIPTQLGDFWRDETGGTGAGSGAPIHRDAGLAAASFELPRPGAGGQGPGLQAAGAPAGISCEMQSAVDDLVASQVGRGYWDDEVLSSLARPLDATAYCSRSLQLSHTAAAASFATSVAIAGVGEPAACGSGMHVMGLQETKAEHRAALFNYNDESHQMAHRLQRCWRKRARAKERAARALQRAYRGAALRADVCALRAERLAAIIVIQAVMRGGCGRFEARRRRNVERSRLLLKVQRLYRGAVGRIGAVARMHARNAAAAAAIQAGAIGRRARRRCTALREEQRADGATLLQAQARGMLARIWASGGALSRRLAATAIQRRYRRYCRFAKERAAASLQRLFRFNLMTIFTRRIQANFRGTRGRFAVSREKQKRVVAERARRLREVNLVFQHTLTAAEALRAAWKTKPGKKELKATVATLKTARKVRARELKKLGAEERRREECRALFRTVDVDDSGAIDADEFAALMKEMCVPLDGASELAEAIATIDADGNGEVDFGEFYAWLHGAQHASHEAGHRAKMALLKIKLRAGKFMRDLTGKSARSEAKRVQLAKAKAKAYKKFLPAFRVRNPPPFSRACTRAFTFPWELAEFEKKHAEHPRHELRNVDELERWYISDATGLPGHDAEALQHAGMVAGAAQVVPVVN